MTFYMPASDTWKQPRKRVPSNKPRQKNKAPERAIQVPVVKILRRHAQRMWWSVPNGGYRHLFTAMKLKAEGLRRGVPDLCFVLEHGVAGFLELKADKGKLSPEQIMFRDAVTLDGAKWASASSIDEAIQILGEWNVLPFTVNPKSQPTLSQPEVSKGEVA